MAIRKNKLDSGFEKISKPVYRPKGKQNLKQLVVSEAEEQSFGANDSPTFKDSVLELFYEEGYVTELIRVIKSGKEASVYLATGKHSLLAVKIYIDREICAFKNRTLYQEGREVLGRRLQRALNKRTRYGRAADHMMWIEEEYAQLCVLHAAGVPVPKPVKQLGRVLLMEYVGDELDPAPRLSDIRLPASEARDAFKQCVHNLGLILREGLVHGDYSTYNILWWEKRAIVIDFPQVVKVEMNPHAMVLLRRDVRSLCKSFEKLGIHEAPLRIEAQVLKYLSV